MGDDEEAVDHPKGQRWHGEEVHRGDGLAVIAQKCHPSPCRLRVSWSLPHPAQHRPLRDVETQHPQLAMNAGRSPGRVLGHHAEDQIPQLFACRPPSCAPSPSRDPCPIALEPSPVPANNLFGLDDDERPLPARPEPPEYHPEEAIRQSKPWLRVPYLQGRELLPQSKDFQEQRPARAEDAGNQTDENTQRSEHEVVLAELAPVQIWSKH